MAQSLFKACKQVIRDGISGTKDVGGHDVFIEYYTQEDIDENVRKIKYGEASKCTFGDTDESKVVLVASPVLTIPSGFTLTPASPKKSLVIICNTLINEGTISMTAKAPNVLPHDWYLVGKVDGYSENVVIPAYANNGVPKTPVSAKREGRAGLNGNNGIARQCGSGGTGSYRGTQDDYYNASGSGYAFGGGAGSGGVATETQNSNNIIPNTVYPMRGGDVYVSIPTHPYFDAFGGVGNPCGKHSYEYTTNFIQNTGCGGRIIIFCNVFVNDGFVNSNGTSCKNAEIGVNGNTVGSMGGASGGGSVDIFYVSINNNGNITVNGGVGAYTTRSGGKFGEKSGNGGNGSITYSDGNQAPLWIMPDIFKPREKYMSKDNMIYFLGELVKRINND